MTPIRIWMQYNEEKKEIRSLSSIFVSEEMHGLQGVIVWTVNCLKIWCDMSDSVSIVQKRLFLSAVLMGWLCSISVLCIQIFFVVPRFSLLYADAQKDVPALTSFVISLSNMLIGYLSATICFLLIMNVIFGICTYLVQRKEAKRLYVTYASVVFLAGGIVNIAFFASLYFPVFSQ